MSVQSLNYNNQSYLIDYNKGTQFLEKGKPSKAVPLLKKSIEQYPTGDAYLNLGTCYKYLDRDSAASDCFRKAIEFGSHGKGNIPALAYTNLGLMSYVYDDDNTAIALLSRADELQPGIGDANWNKATAMLRKACSGAYDLFTAGWAQYEYRFKKSSPVTIKGTFGHLRDKTWIGEKGIRLLVCAEQGLGDNIMFARYLPTLAATYNVDITLQGSSDIASLLWEGKNVNIEFNPLDYDYVLPLGSICRFVGFISADPYVDFKDKFDLPGINIGIVWSGNTKHSNDRHRSVSAQRFKRFSKYGKLWSLNPAAECPAWANKCGVKNWTDTAKWLNSMDLVITVDTSIVHLAGAMGVRTWLVQPYKETDFRWGNHNNKSNVWYSSVDVYRNPNDWEFVFDRIEEDLNEIF